MADIEAGDLNLEKRSLAGWPRWEARQENVEGTVLANRQCHRSSNHIRSLSSTRMDTYMSPSRFRIEPPSTIARRAVQSDPNPTPNVPVLSHEPPRVAFQAPGWWARGISNRSNSGFFLALQKLELPSSCQLKGIHPKPIPRKGRRIDEMRQLCRRPVVFTLSGGHFHVFTYLPLQTCIASRVHIGAGLGIRAWRSIRPVLRTENSSGDDDPWVNFKCCTLSSPLSSSSNVWWVQGIRGLHTASGLVLDGDHLT